jgi:hypothetical protein
MINLLTTIENIVQEQPNINQIIQFNPYDLNGLREAKYTAIGYTLNSATEDKIIGFITYNLSLIYIDRLTTNKSNQKEIYSTGLKTLKRIIDMLTIGQYDIPNVEYQFFSDEYADKCAGVFATFQVKFTTGDCIY